MQENEKAGKGAMSCSEHQSVFPTVFVVRFLNMNLAENDWFYGDGVVNVPDLVFVAQQFSH